MRQQCVWISVVFLVAICGAVGSQECTEERANECKGKLLEILFGDFSEEEACGHLYDVSKCLRKMVDDCLGDEEHPDVEESLKEFDDILSNTCETSEDDDDEIGNCLEENQDYLMECVFDKETGEIKNLLDIDQYTGDISRDALPCFMYFQVAYCVISRSEKKCGKTAGDLAAKEMFDLSDVPTVIQESCSYSGDSVEASPQELISINLLDQRRKRNLGNRKKRSLEYIKKRALEFKK